MGLFSRATGQCPRANATASNALRETNMLTTTTVNGGGIECKALYGGNGTMHRKAAAANRALRFAGRPGHTVPFAAGREVCRSLDGGSVTMSCVTPTGGPQ